VNKILVILNPAARGDRAKGLRQTISKLSLRATVRTTSGPGDAEALAERGVEQGYKTIVAAGGDGTVNEVVNGIAEADVNFGILPVGTMNVFALELGLPMNNLAAAWKVIEHGHTRRIDLPKANDEYFVQLAGIGLDAEVVRQTSRDSKRALGPLSYIVSLANVAAQKPPRIHLETNSGLKYEGCFALIGNGRFYGGPFEMFKKASIDDGLLDIVVFKNQSHWDAIRYMQGLLFGTHARFPDVEYVQAEAVDVTSPGSVPIELDGELAGALPCRFEMAKHPLYVLSKSGKRARLDKKAGGR